MQLIKKPFPFLTAALALATPSFLLEARADTVSETVLSPDAIARIVAPSEKVKLLASGFNFVEGPTWNRNGFWVFSDIPANSLFKITPEGKVALVRRPTGNGNAYDRSLALLSCESGARRVSRKNTAGVFETLAEKYGEKRLNSPNDLAVKSDGSIYFTDPTYGIDASAAELDFRGLYRLFPGGKLELLDKNWTQPNGICFSPDERTLYVNDSQQGEIFRFDVDAAGALSKRTPLATIPKPGDPDSMKCDAEGHLFVAAPGGVWVFAPRGGLLGKIPVPKNPANLAFGGADGKTLLITARDSVYSVRLNVGQASITRNRT